MKIQCHPVSVRPDPYRPPRALFFVEGTTLAQHTGVYRESCVHFGFTEQEIDAAEASPGKWIDCPREAECQHCGAVVCDGADTHCRKCDTELAVNQSEDLAAVTAQRDRLLRGCKFLVSLKGIAGDFDGMGDNDFRFTVLDAREIKEAESAIADVEKTREKVTT